MKRTKVLVCCILLTASAGSAQDVEIMSFHGNGELTWTNATTGVVCHVEWASSPEGPWLRTWNHLTAITITGATTTVDVPTFYRVSCVTGSATVVNIDVGNASFELPNVSGYTCTMPTGWFEGEPGGCDIGINDQNTGSFTAPHGEQVAYVNTGRTMSHTVTDVLTAENRYTLTVAIGTRSDHGGGYDVRLKAGGVTLGSAHGSLSAGMPFEDVSLVYDAPGDHAQLGQPLSIELAGSTQPQYDNVRLTVQPLP